MSAERESALFRADLMWNVLNDAPGDDELGVAGCQGAPLASADGPLALAETHQSVALRPDRVQDGDEIAGAIGHVEAARDGRFVDVHRVRILEAWESRRQQIHHHQVVLEQHDDRVRVLRLCNPTR